MARRDIIRVCPPGGGTVLLVIGNQPMKAQLSFEPRPLNPVFTLLPLSILTIVSTSLNHFLAL